MTNFLTRFKEEQEGGFTLIELLVVILIIGILSAIAIPAFLNQRKGAVDSSVKSDLTNAGTVLATEALAGKTLNSTVTITSDGPLNASGEVELFQRVANTGAMDTSGIKVSEGTSIILKPSSVDGGICMFAVNPAGDISAKSPGFVYDSLAGGRLNEGSTPVACADDAGQLAVPEAQIERALAGEEDVVAAPGDDQPAEGILFRHEGTLYDYSKGCYLANGQYVITGTPGETNDYFDYSVSGLDGIAFEGGGNFSFTANGNKEWAPIWDTDLSGSLYGSGEMTNVSFNAKDSFTWRIDPDRNEDGNGESLYFENPVNNGKNSVCS